MVVTGTSASRLNELRKYTVTNVFSNQYVNINGNSDGVSFDVSIPNKFIVYYIGGIQYIDTINNNITTTTFKFDSVGTNSADFIQTHYFQDPNKENIVSQPKINDDVFIVRQEISAFDGNYRLEYIQRLVDLTTYAGGNFFNIVNNT
jgi:hypothetical protein